MNASSSDTKTIFGRAIEIEDAAAREAYLNQACGPNDQLRAEIDSLIGAHLKVGDFLKGPARNAATCLDESGSGEEGMVIGRYKLLERIGEGGMGVVFMADQHAPVRRRVALKIIKPGMDTREVLARFDAERQALALMDHPNIARALDAGATDSGRPYFVMELVRGVPITDYCDQNNLAVNERLALFVDVCRAVQHAHQKGVIHRDIKPSNILITLFDGRPVPKIIDFGVAKAIHQPLTQKTLFTRFAEMIGTPLYMSPEQAQMTALDIDTRSDIYSLGVLLYELLTGTTPFDSERLKQAAYDEIRRIIREEEPAKPSTRISSLGDKSTVVAAHRHADPHRLSQIVSGDLDWIVMKALEKERLRRYETAIGLAMDVERHLADEPVLACPPSVTYRFTKFARRNRVAFATSIVVLVAILVGTVVSITQAIRATHAEHLAESGLRAEAAAHAEAERAHYDLANAFRDAKRMADAESHYRQALVQYDALIAASGTKPEYELQRAQCHNEFAVMLTWAGRPADAEGEYRQSIALKEKLVADAPANAEYRCLLAHSCLGLADLLDNNKRTREAKVFGRQALALFEKLADEFPSSGDYRLEVGHTLWRLSNVAWEAGQLDEQEQDDRRALAIFAKLAADFPQNRYCQLEQGQSDWNIAGVMRQQNRLPEAEKSYRDASDVYAKMLADLPGDGGPRIRLAQIELDLAEVLRAENRLDEAEKHCRLAEAAWRKLGVDNPTDPVYRIRAIDICANQLSSLLAAKGRAREAEENYRQAVGLLASLPANELVADDRRDLTDTCYGNLVRLLKSSNRPQEATAVFREWVDLRRKAFTNMLEQNPKSADAQNSLGEALARVGCWDEALAAIDKAAELDPANHWYPFRAAPLHLRAGDVAGYRRACRAMLERFHGTQALEIAERTAKTCLLAPAAVPDVDRVQKLADQVVTGTNDRWFLFVKGLAEYRAGRHKEAVKWLDRFGPDAHGSHIDASGFAVRAMAQHRLGQMEQARAALHSGQALVAEKMPDPAAGRPFDGMWQDWLHCQILLREAEALVGKKLSSSPPSTNAAAKADKP